MLFGGYLPSETLSMRRSIRAIAAIARRFKVRIFERIERYVVDPDVMTGALRDARRWPEMLGDVGGAVQQTRNYEIESRLLTRSQPGMGHPIRIVARNAIASATHLFDLQTPI